MQNRDGSQAFLNPVAAIHGELRPSAIASAVQPVPQKRGEMRVVVGPRGVSDFRQAELDGHLAAISRAVERAKAEGRPSPGFTLILRSASSAPARALVRIKNQLECARLDAKVVLAKIEPQVELRQLFTSLALLAPRQHPSELIRWARNPRLLDAHEQVTYGNAICWSGDAMRREADRRNALTFFNEAAPEMVRLARLAFEALWAASSPVPERYLVDRPATRPSGSYGQAQEPAADSPVRPSLQAWPLVRH
jgi:hypothetical protein